MRMSEQINELAAALSKAQGEIKNATKGSENPFFRSRYADLASVWDACREQLSRHQLAVVQVPEAQEGKITVHTVLMHSSGQWIDGELTMTLVKDDPQGAGSAITYAKRYALTGFVGIAPEDDDGNAASGKQEGAQRTAVKVGTKSDAPPLPKANGSSPADMPIRPEGIAVGQRTNFRTTFERALPKERAKEAVKLYAAYLTEHEINFDTMSPDDFYAIRDEAEAYAKNL